MNVTTIILRDDNMKILIIEDEYNLADIIKDRLVKEKYTINICADGGEVTLNMKDQQVNGKATN